MERYAAYKDSGVEWINEIPEGWQIRRFKELYKESDERVEDATPSELLSVSEYYGVDYRANHVTASETLVRAETLAGYKKCYPGYLVMNIMLAWRGAQGTSKHEGVVSPSYGVFMPIAKMNEAYMHYLLRTDLYAERFKRYSTGIIDSRLRLYPYIFLRLSTLFPPIEQQNAIASYLDAKTAEIDGIIKEAARSIELLREYRKSVISEAVTHGLNPNIPMKDSGIEWIGESPSTWKFEKSKYHMAFINGRAYKREELLDDGPFRVLRVGNFNTNERWYYTDLNLPSEQYCDNGDLLYLWATTFGPEIWTGEKVVFHYHIWKVNLNASYTKKYAYYALTASSAWLELQSHGSTMVHITKHGMENTYLPLPPIEDQQEIADYLDAKTAEIDGLIADKEKQVDLLKEYRKSLISEAVTGKFKVPGLE